MNRAFSAGALLVALGAPVGASAQQPPPPVEGAAASGAQPEVAPAPSPSGALPPTAAPAPARSAPAQPAPSATAPPAYGYPPNAWQPPPPGWPPPPAPGQAYPAAPGSPPPADRAATDSARKPGSRLHDGFYLRVGIGYGLLHTSSSFAGQLGSRPADEALGEFTYSGSGVALDFGIGGTPASGVVIGYGFMGQIAFEPSVTLDTPSGEQERRTREHLGAAIHGLLIDVFPDPSGNLELGGLVGIGRVSTGADGDESDGIAAAVWGGYGFWAGDGASLVGLLRLGYAFTEAEIESFGPGSSAGPNMIDRSDSTFTLSVVTAALVH